MKQLIYRIKHDQWLSHDAEPVTVVTTLGQILRWFPALFSAMSFKDFCKLSLKLCKGDKAIYFHQENNQIQSYGIITFGYCKLYPIAGNDAVIGPVNTLHNFSGKGLATKTLKAAINWLFMARECSAVYIDTSEANNAMQRVIKKSGFTEPVDDFTR